MAQVCGELSACRGRHTSSARHFHSGRFRPSFNEIGPALCQQASGKTFAKYWRCRALDTLREMRRIYDLLTSGPTLDRPHYVLDRGVTQRPAETGDDRAQSRAEQRHIASNAG
jgi:hypothetical protein